MTVCLEYNAESFTASRSSQIMSCCFCYYSDCDGDRPQTVACWCCLQVNTDLIIKATHFICWSHVAIFTHSSLIVEEPCVAVDPKTVELAMCLKLPFMSANSFSWKVIFIFYVFFWYFPWVWTGTETSPHLLHVNMSWVANTPRSPQRIKNTQQTTKRVDIPPSRRPALFTASPNH